MGALLEVILGVVHPMVPQWIPSLVQMDSWPQQIRITVAAYHSLIYRPVDIESSLL